MKASILKKSTSIFLAMVMIMSVFSFFPRLDAKAAEENMIEVRTWEEFENAFGLYEYEGKSWTIKLMNDLNGNAVDTTQAQTEYKTVEVKGNNVTLDFNGHTLSFIDKVSTSNLQSKLSDFIRIVVHPIDTNAPATFRLIDSVGGGGVSMDSHRAADNQLAALHIEASDIYYVSGNVLQAGGPRGSVIIDGGTYSLKAKTEKIGSGTLVAECDYRGCVIVDSFSSVTVNDGSFTVESDGVYYTGDDFCARELSAFATCCSTTLGIQGAYYGHVQINGGFFKSDGFSVHHFDSTKDADETIYMEFPTIRGGLFSGALGYIGHSFTYEEYGIAGGYNKWKESPASHIIPSDVIVIGIDNDNDRFTDVENMDLENLHNVKTLAVISETAVDMTVTPSLGFDEDGYPCEKLVRTERDSDVFEISYEIDSWAKDIAGIKAIPTLGYRLNWESSDELKTFNTDTLTIDYGDWDFHKGLTVVAQLLVLLSDEQLCAKTIEIPVEVLHYYKVTSLGDNMNISAPAEILQGEALVFNVTPMPYYEFVNESKLYVTINGKVQPQDPSVEGNGYVVPNVQGDIEIIANAEMKGYTNFNIMIDGNEVAEYKIYKGKPFRLPYLDMLGYILPQNTTFDHWKVQGFGTKFAEGDYIETVNTVGEVTITAVFTGYYPIELENGAKAYADEAHTQPITQAAADSYVYITAPAIENKHFDIWEHEMMDNASSFPYFQDATALETRFRMPSNGIILRPTYLSTITDIKLNNVVKPVAGQKFVLNHDEYYNNWLETVPEGAPYGFNYAYWYRVDGENLVELKEGDIFEAGQTYRYKANLYVKDKTFGFPTDASDINFSFTGISPKFYELTTEYASARTYFIVTADFTCGEVMYSGSVNGTVTSFGNETDKVMLQLIDKSNNENTYYAFVTGNSAEYNISGVAAGTYILRASKNKHETSETTVVVDNGNVTQNIDLALSPSNADYMLGDVDGDNDVDADDYILLKRIFFGTSKLEKLKNPETALVRSDVDKNGEIKADDYIYLKRAYFGMYKIK